MDQNEIDKALAQIEKIGRDEQQGVLQDLAKGLKDGLGGLAKVVDMHKAAYGGGGQMNDGTVEDDVEPGMQDDGQDGGQPPPPPMMEGEGEDLPPMKKPAIDDDEGPGPGSFDMGKGDQEFLDITDTVERLQKSVANIERLAVRLAQAQAQLNHKLDQVVRAQPLLAKGIHGIESRMNLTEAPSRGESAFRPQGRREDITRARRASGLTEADVFDGMLKGIIDESHSSLWNRTGKLSKDDAEHKALVSEIKSAA